jgi:hypothetical protein
MQDINVAEKMVSFYSVKAGEKINYLNKKNITSKVYQRRAHAFHLLWRNSVSRKMNDKSTPRLICKMHLLCLRFC